MLAETDQSILPKHTVPLVPRRGWLEFLDAAAESRTISNVAVSGLQLLESRAFQEALRARDLVPVHALNPLGEEAERYLFEHDGALRSKLVTQWVRVLNQLAEFGVQSTAMELGLDRIAPDRTEAQVQLRISTLKYVISCFRSPLTIACRLRCPRNFPSSKAWECAAEMLQGVTDSACCLQLDLFPDEDPDGEEHEKALGAFHLHAGAVALHWTPAAGAAFDGDVLQTTLKQLRQRGYRGLLVLAPQLHNDIERFRAFVAALDAASAPPPR